MSGLMADPTVRRAVLVLGGLALVAGLSTLLLGLADGQPFLATQGVRLGTLMHLNPLGALVTVALAVLTLAAGAVRSRLLVQLAAASWLLAALQVVAQGGREPNVLGGTASTLAFFLAMAAGLAAIGFTPDAGDRVEEKERAP